MLFKFLNIVEILCPEYPNNQKTISSKLEGKKVMIDETLKGEMSQME